MSDGFSPERLIDDLCRLAGAAVHDVLPIDAQKHLLAAQRELFLAVTTTLEHHADRGRRTQSPAHRKKPAARKRPKRVPLD